MQDRRATETAMGKENILPKRNTIIADQAINGDTRHLRHLNEECRQLLKKAGNLVEVNVLEDPCYHVADDQIA